MWFYLNSFHLNIIFLGSAISDYSFFASVVLILPVYSCCVNTVIWLCYPSRPAELSFRLSRMEMLTCPFPKGGQVLLRYQHPYFHKLSKLYGLEEFHFSLGKDKVVFITEEQPDRTANICRRNVCACKLNEIS